jgi:hypothetical protein
MRTSLSSHTSHRLRATHISPVFPQVWMVPVNKGVYNSDTHVLFGRSVRLSPYVDYLWMKPLSTATHSHSICGWPARLCAYSQRRCQSYTSLHNRTCRGSTPHPQSHGPKLRPTRRPIHTFPSPYDDDYRDIPDKSHRPSKNSRWITALLSEREQPEPHHPTASRKGELS